MNKTKIEWCDSTWNPVTGCGKQRGEISNGETERYSD